MMKKRSFLSVALCLLIFITSIVPICAAENKAVVVAAPGSGTVPLNPFEKAIYDAVISVFKEQAQALKPKLVEQATPKLEAIKKDLEATITSYKNQMDSLSIDESINLIDTSMLPPKEQVDQIPDIAIQEVKANALNKASQAIAEEFKKSQEQNREQINKFITNAAPQVIEKIKPSVQSLILSLSTMIEDDINNSIEEKIMEVIPDVMDKMPKEYEDLTPEQIAEKLESKMRPGVESAVRPIIEQELMGVMQDLVAEKIEKPISSIMTPKILDLDVTAYDANVDKIPAYLDRIISKGDIKSLVHENVERLKASLPETIKSEQDIMSKKIKAYIDDEIGKANNIYVAGKKIKLSSEPKLIKNKVMIPFAELTKLIPGTKVKYDYAKKQVTIEKDKKKIVMPLDSNIILVNGKKLKVDATGILDKKQPLLPVEVTTKLMGYKCEWQPDWKLVTITK